MIGNISSLKYHIYPEIRVVYHLVKIDRVITQETYVLFTLPTIIRICSIDFVQYHV